MQNNIWECRETRKKKNSKLIHCSKVLHKWGSTVVNASHFVLEVSSEERARPSVTVCFAERTWILIKYHLQVHFTSRTHACFKWVTGCSMHPNELMCLCSKRESWQKRIPKLWDWNSAKWLVKSFDAQQHSDHFGCLFVWPIFQN